MILCDDLRISDKLKQEFNEKEAEMRAEFDGKMNEIKRKSADDLNACKADMIAKLKREYGKCHRCQTCFKH